MTGWSWCGLTAKSITMSALSVMVNDEMPIRRVQGAKRDTATRFGGKWSAKTLEWSRRGALDSTIANQG